MKWVFAKPAKRSLARDTVQTIEKLETIIEDQTNPSMARSLVNLRGMLRGLVGHQRVMRERRNAISAEKIEEFEKELISALSANGSIMDLLVSLDLDDLKKQARSRRSADLWTCDDLVVIIREYNYVIDLLVRINNFIRENILTKLSDQMDDQVRDFVTNTLALYTEAEGQLRTKRQPFVQYQTDLSCDSTVSTAVISDTSASSADLKTSTATTPTEKQSVTSTTLGVGTSEASSTTAVAITIDVREITQNVTTQKTKLEALLNDLDPNLEQYSQLTSLMGFLDNLITTLNQITTSEIGGRMRRSAADECDLLIPIKAKIEEAIDSINKVIAIIDALSTTDIKDSNIWEELEHLRSNLASVRTSLQSYITQIDAFCLKSVTTSTRAAVSSAAVSSEVTGEESTQYAPGATSSSSATDDQTHHDVTTGSAQESSAAVSSEVTGEESTQSAPGVTSSSPASDDDATSEGAFSFFSLVSFVGN